MNKREIFIEALQKEDPAQRSAFLKAACGQDTELRKQIEELLVEHERDDSFFIDSPPPGVEVTIDLPVTEKPGTQIGPYKIREQIGEGGMGVVYVAEQKEPVRRMVALKIIKPGMDSKEVTARFEVERQALAIMDHPNIAKMHDAGLTESDRPYFVMELVRGLAITDYCDRRQLSTRDRLKLFVTVCRAVQHAHLKGIIHRDIKPSNVMVMQVDGSGVPKVIDFGVAKATNQQLSEGAVYTQFSQMLGTPLYMSPEQAELSGADIDTRTDVYSLGVLLYELLTGHTPFDREVIRQASFDEMRRIIREDEPPRPSMRISTLAAEALSTLSQQRDADPRTLSRQVSGELDWLVMQALEKDRVRRYESASAFAADVERYLMDEPVEACPPSLSYQFRKFARRNKATMVTVASVALALVLGAGIATGQAVRATKAERLAKRQERLAVKQQRLAEEAAETEKKLPTVAVRQREQAESLLLLALQDFNPVGAAFGPDGNFYVSSTGTSRVLQFDGRTGAFISEFVTAGSGGLDGPQGLVFGPDANGDGADDLYVSNRGGNSVLQYDGATGAFLSTFVSVGSGGLRFPTGLTFGPDGNLYVMSFHSHSILRYDATDGRFLDEFVPARSGGLNSPQMGVFGPDGNLYVASFETDSVLRYDGTSGDFMDDFVPPGSGGLCRPEALAFGPEGTLYAISGRSAGVLRYDGNSGKFLDEFIPLGAGGLIGGQTLVFGPDGNLYVTSISTDRVPRFDGETGEFIDMFVTYDRKRLIGSINSGPTARRDLIRSYLQMAVAQQQMGNDEEAERIVGRAFELAAEFPDESAALKYAQLFVNAGWAQEATQLMTQFEPRTAEDYTQRANLLQQLEDYEKALADYEKAIELGTVTYYMWYKYALCCLGADDRAAYRKACADMLQQFAESEIASELYFAAWSCVLAPDAVDDYSPAIELAERAVEVEPSDRNQQALGAVLYRAGRFEEAIETLQSIAESEEPENTSPVYGWYFLAMAQHAAGDSEKASQWLKKAVEWTDRVLKEEQEEGATPVAWNRRLTLKFLRSEAEALLYVADTDKKPESPTEDVLETDEPNTEQRPPSTDPEETTDDE